jgi:hypothetical protein
MRIHLAILLLALAGLPDLPWDSTIFLLVREDLPLAERLQRASMRADLVPRLARQAREALAATAPSGINPEICQLAGYQTRASAEIYRASFPKAAEGQPEALKKWMGESGSRAAAALDELAACYVREEAFQNEQFAGNMWMRVITSSPLLSFYHLGYRQVMGLYEDVRTARGTSFDLRAFMDGMMEMGPVPVAHYRRKMLQ